MSANACYEGKEPVRQRDSCNIMSHHLRTIVELFMFMSAAMILIAASRLLW